MVPLDERGSVGAKSFMIAAQHSRDWSDDDLTDLKLEAKDNGNPPASAGSRILKGPRCGDHKQVS